MLKNEKMDDFGGIIFNGEVVSFLFPVINFEEHGYLGVMEERIRINEEIC